MKKTRTFQYDTERIQTSDAAEIKRLRACGWRELKTPKQVFAKGLTGGKNFLD